MATDKISFLLIKTVMIRITFVFGYHRQGVFHLHHPNCSESGVELIPKSDCSGFFICADGKTYEETCHYGWVFSHSAHGCVPKGRSFIDDCETVADKCTRDVGGIFPHDLECQLYYNCSNNNTVTFHIYMGAAGGLDVTEPFLQECPYPNLFNAQTLKCEDFENVTCGMRNEIVTKCKYWAHKSYYGNHARPCSLDNPSCEGLPDGENMYPERQWTPYYINCWRGRTIDSAGFCPSLNVSDMDNTQFFHPILRMCVPLYRIPKEHGGYMPDCSNQPNGEYPVDFGSCRYFSVCVNGEFDDVYACDGGMLFDVVSTVCVPPSTARCK